MDLRQHNPFTLFLHWVTAVLVVIAFVYGPGGSEERVYSTARDADRQLHETLGLLVLLLTLVRLGRVMFGAAGVMQDEADWTGAAARWIRRVLYLLLLVVPLSAITGAWLEGHPLTLLADLRIAPLLPTMHRPGTLIAQAHGWLGDTILWIAGVHAAAALFHHFVLRDRVLLSMLPSVVRRRLGAG